MALVDGDYKFIWVDIGSPGSCSDSQVFNNCELKEVIESGDIGFPPDATLPNDRPEVKTPFYILGDDAFALQTWMMKPYSRRNMTHQELIFNYRLSRARRIVENAFGLLATKFMIMHSHMRHNVDTVEEIVMATCTLHNLIRIRYPQDHHALADQDNQDHNIVPGAWRDGAQMEDLGRAYQGNALAVAKAQRDMLKTYFNSAAGSVPWQDRMVPDV
jgi:hypothetical protein